MKRSGFGPRKTPMARGSWSRKSSPLPESTKPARKTAIKSQIKRSTVAEGSKYLAACRGEPCYLLAVHGWTGYEDPTVVPCHSNFSKHGKAGARKADHRYTVPGCMWCHTWLDTGMEIYAVKVATFDSALARWEPVRARKMGLEQTELEEA